MGRGGIPARWRPALVAAALSSLVSCGTVLGLDDIHYHPDSGEGSDGALVPAPIDGEAPADAAPAPGEDAAQAAPVTLVSGLGLSLASLAIDATRLYWVDTGGGTLGGSVLSAPKAGGAPTTIATGQSMPLDIAVDTQNVYWSVSEPTSAAGGPVVCNAMFVNKSAPGAAPTCATQSQYATMRMTINDSDVVLLAHAGGNGENFGFVAKGVALDPYKNIAAQGPASALAASDSNVYVSNGNGHHIDQIALPALTVGPNLCLDTCGTATIADMVLDVALQNVLWVTTPDGNVYTAPVAVTNKTGTLLGTIGAPPNRVARDGSYLYVSAQNGSIYAVRIGAGAGAAKVLTIASGEQAPFGIAVDATNVYFTAAGAIRALPAPAP